MRIQVTLKPVQGPLVLPQNYQHILQGFLYQSIDASLADKLHECKFKGFTYSLLFGNYSLDAVNHRIKFSDTVTFLVSSIRPEFILNLSLHLLQNNKFRLGDTEVLVVSVQELSFSIEEDTAKIRMLSPMTVHRTVIYPNGKRGTVFFSPDEPEFIDLLNHNLQSKCQALCLSNDKKQLQLTPLGKCRKVVLPYKGYTIIAYMGDYQISASNASLRFLYDVGLGDRNSSGFGMFEILP